MAFDSGSLEMQVSEGGAACANRPLIACNWFAEDGGIYCQSCRLTRTIPNLGSQSNILLWSSVERAKRRLIYDLYRLQLPIEGLAFDILADEIAGHPITTGHLAGLITLSLAEADDVEREMRRAAFREPYRTLLGHFRHEIGHFYWDALIADSQLKGPFRVVFGNERSYGDSLSAYHARAGRLRDHEGFVSEYATAHPWEDWAETFAHFLHVVSTLDTAAAASIGVEAQSPGEQADPYLATDFDSLLMSWNSVAQTMNELNRSMGLGDAYPFRLSPAVKGKLHLVHMAVCNFRDRLRPKGASRAADCVSAVLV